jgi:succinate dehydrogenase / fumarate reductase iron-sulfur subunit
MADQRTFRLFRGSRERGELQEYQVAAGEGMVVLDAVHAIQAEQAPDLAVRWNCKAGKCGSCSAEVNGKPRLMCMTRISDYPADAPITVTPMKAFPVIKDLVTDVSWNYEVNKRIPEFKPRAPDFPDGTWRMYQYEVERPQEFRKCIECFLCQDVCHVLRTHGKHDVFMGPAMLVRVGGYEMHPLDEADRREYLRADGGVGYCNITKCCTEVCPESITITDNAIIPLKERVVDARYDPVAALLRKLTG